ncbi:hypothetical protein, partial [Burkholderia humptydooensis]|uniref:hypothetical protein n=1 Tax=Burkholderia humptydooensis TaxID=430531 RepID=UPI001E4FE8B2
MPALSGGDAESPPSIQTSPVNKKARFEAGFFVTGASRSTRLLELRERSGHRARRLRLARALRP